MKVHPTFLLAVASLPLFGQTTSAGPTRLLPITVQRRENNLLGVTDSATVGFTGAAQLSERPLLRPGELLETVPGLIITQHAGGGKANQYFLRGFNLDHGTDFATFLDGVPLNMPSHGHGQGYADMNVVIPELVAAVRYQKGPYYANTGDFSTAGSADLTFLKRLPQALYILEGGSYNYARMVAADSRQMGEGTLLYGLELLRSDGPWAMPDQFNKVNGQLSWSTGDERNGHTVTARLYQGHWRSSDQIPQALVDAGTLSRFGNMDPSNGGQSRYASVQSAWHQQDAKTTEQLLVYVFRYDLDLFSNFTYALANPAGGDQFEQADRRTGAGLTWSRSVVGDWAGRATETTVGLQVRNDWVTNGLYDTTARTRTGTPKAQHDLSVGLAGLYAEHKIQWTPTFRTVFGGRGDVQYTAVSAQVNAADSGDAQAALFSPKLSLIWGPWAKTEYFLQAGYGFHSNDARGTTLTSSGSAPLRGLQPARGAEFGIRCLVVDGLQSTFSWWYLHNSSELVFVGDEGTLEASGASRRYGIEWANYYTPNPWLSFDLDLAASQALYTEGAAGNRRVEQSINTVVAAGVTVRDGDAWAGSLRLRYFGPRNLTTDGAVRTDATLMLNGAVSYQFNPRWKATVEVLNLLGREDQDIAYYYESSATNGAEGLHFHPVEPRQFRLSLTGRF